MQAIFDRHAALMMKFTAAGRHTVAKDICDYIKIYDVKIKMLLFVIV